MTLKAYLGVSWGANKNNTPILVWVAVLSVGWWELKIPPKWWKWSRHSTMSRCQVLGLMLNWVISQGSLFLNGSDSWIWINFGCTALWFFTKKTDHTSPIWTSVWVNLTLHQPATPSSKMLGGGFLDPSKAPFHYHVLKWRTTMGFSPENWVHLVFLPPMSPRK